MIKLQHQVPLWVPETKYKDGTPRTKALRPFRGRREAMPRKKVKAIKKHLCRGDKNKMTKLKTQFCKSIITYYRIFRKLIFMF